jgi:glycosyltransferase involved in cell wall biosynthesis
VIEDGVTGFIVESEADAAAAIGRARHLDRGRIRETFERRFSARRMAEAYVESYQALLESARSGASDHVRELTSATALA